jgi:anti-sigma-K factor RskA
MHAAGPGHEQWRDATGAYLLGALDEAERAAFEEHLAGCPACREEVDLLRPATQVLPISVDALEPPPGLKARIMAEVEREASLLAAAGPDADRVPAPARRRLRLSSLRVPRLVPAAVAAMLLIVGVAIGVGATQLGSQHERTVEATVTDPAKAPGAGARIEVGEDGVVIVAHNLPAPPSGRVYQVWLKRPGHAPEPTSALFTPSRDGTATASVPGEMDGVAQVLVTDEPDGGSRTPTRDPLLVADMS